MGDSDVDSMVVSYRDCTAWCSAPGGSSINGLLGSGAASVWLGLRNLPLWLLVALPSGALLCVALLVPSAWFSPSSCLGIFVGAVAVKVGWSYPLHIRSRLINPFAKSGPGTGECTTAHSD